MQQSNYIYIQEGSEDFSVGSLQLTVAAQNRGLDYHVVESAHSVQKSLQPTDSTTQQGATKSRK